MFYVQLLLLIEEVVSFQVAMNTRDWSADRLAWVNVKKALPGTVNRVWTQNLLKGILSSQKAS